MLTPWLWLGGSLLLAILWANLSQIPQRSKRETPHAAEEARTDSGALPGWALEGLRLVYYVGLPYVALLSGAVVEHHLWPRRGPAEVVGVARSAGWLAGIGWAMAIGVGAWLCLAVAWWSHRRALAAVGEQANVPRVSGWTLLREAVYREVHWAFYRNAPIAVLGAYWGTWAGLGVVALEALLDPGWRGGLADPRRVLAQLMHVALAVVSGVLFLETGNLLFAVLVHWGVSWGLAALSRGHAIAPAGSPEPA